MYNSDLLEIIPLACMYYNGYNLKINGPFRPVKMTHFELDIITSGRAHLVIDDVSYMYYPGDISFRKPGQFNQHLFDTSYECLHFRFDVNNIGSEYNFFAHLPTFIPKDSNRDIRDAVSTFHKHYYDDSEYNNIVCRAMLLMIKASLFKQLHPVTANSAVTYHSTIRRAIDLMEKNIANQIKIEEIAEYCGYSIRHFQKIFKDATGVSPHQYLLNLKINYAKELLLTTNHTVHHISLQCGFFDSNYFTNAFKRVVGTTPSKFRKENI